jgi:hypothetical protein
LRVQKRQDQKETDLTPRSLDHTGLERVALNRFHILLL